MTLASRMKTWRNARRARGGGMTQLLIWVRVRDANFLKDIFGKLADPSERGSDYRSSACQWLFRRRVPVYHFSGTSYSAEIDLPFIGPHWFRRPAGGRVTGSLGTWIELTPKEADEITLRCRSAVSNALETWLRNNSLTGQVRDHVGVAMDPDFADPDFCIHHLHEGDSVIRPADDSAFEENEARIAREVEREALQSCLHQDDDPTVVYYEGFFGVPSRCHAIHRREGDRIIFALVHIKHGGSSPTHMIEKLAAEMRKRFYPSIPVEKIEWYDCFMVFDHEAARINRVIIDQQGWHWQEAKDLPNDFVQEIEDTVQRNNKLARELDQQ